MPDDPHRGGQNDGVAGGDSAGVLPAERALPRLHRPGGGRGPALVDGQGVGLDDAQRH
ncbi:MAG: hypothetical protein ACRD2C_06655 [Acidimicrobiales bacterium]